MRNRLLKENKKNNNKLNKMNGLVPKARNKMLLDQNKLI